MACLRLSLSASATVVCSALMRAASSGRWFDSVRGGFHHPFRFPKARGRRRTSTLGQVDDLMLVDTEDHLLPTRQLHNEFQLLAGRMHQLDSHIALDLGNFSAEEIAAQEFEAQHVERSR